MGTPNSYNSGDVTINTHTRKYILQQKILEINENKNYTSP